MAKRIDWKKLEQIPAFKKKVARFLAQVDISIGSHATVVNMLTYGQRGYAQFAEKDLVKLFDKSYERVLEAQEELQKDMKENPGNGWRNRERIDTMNALIIEANELVSIIFEKEVLS